MIYGDVELHNVAGARPAEGGGVRLQRMPEIVYGPSAGSR